MSQMTIKLRLKDACETIFSGGTPDTRKPEYWDGDFHWLSSGETRNKFINTTEKTITQKGIDNSSTRLAQRGDVLIASAGQGKTRGQTSFTLIDTYINQSIISLRTNIKKLNSLFLFYLLSSKYETLRNMSDANSIRGSLTCKMFESMEITVPKDVHIQGELSSILYNYDLLIENNSRHIQILEQTAKLIYDEWFVRFKFPGHEKVKMIDSELGKIPEGWKVVKFSDIVDNVKDSVTSEKVAKDLFYLPIDLIPRNSILLTDVAPIEEAQSSLTLFKKEDIVFGAMRAYFHKVIIAPFNGVTRKTCFILRSKNKNLWSYSYLTLFQEKSIEYASQHSNGATIPYAVWDNGLAEMKVILPKNDVLEKFENIVSPILKYAAQTFLRNTNLIKTRDILLPKLISGQIDVSEMNIKVPEVKA